MQASVDDLSYYSESYDLARERFRAQAKEFVTRHPSATTRSFSVASQSHHDLTVDYLFLPATDAKRTLVTMISGVHGVEGFTGSAIQLMFLDEFVQKFFAIERKNSDVGFLFVHAMNPFGFKTLRRSTESNVNLNRNFAVTPDMFKSENPGYRKLAKLLAPPVKATSPQLSFLRNSGQIVLRKMRGDFTAQELVQAVSLGQFEFPTGLEYGGTQYEPQIADFVDVLKQHFWQYKDSLFLDLHTGLGDRYQLHLIPGSLDRPQDLAYCQELLHTEEDKEIYAFTPQTSKGFYRTLGDSNELAMRWLKPEQRGIAVTLEYGTIGNSQINKLDSLNRLILENQGYHHGYANEKVQAQVRQLTLDFFAPSEEKWRRNTIDRARRVFTRIFDRLN